MPSASRRAAVRDGTAFGERLRALRKARGLRQEDLARDRYSAAYVSMLEAGRTRASMKALEHLAAKLNVSVAELLGGGPQPGETDAKLTLAKALLESGDADGTLALLRDLHRDSLTPRQLVEVYRNEARAYHDLRLPKDAMPPLEKALKLAQQLGDGDIVARIRYQMGGVCYYLFQYREAVQHHLAAYEACRSGVVRDAHIEFRILSNLGNDHTALGEHAAAINYYERALAMAEDLVDNERLAGTHAGLAYAYTKQQDYEAAIRHASASLTLYEQLGAERTVPEVMNNLAYLYGRMGNARRADEILERAIEGAERAGNAFAMPQLLLSRAELCARKDPARARAIAGEALAAALRAEQKEGILSARLFLASLETDVKLGRAAFEETRRFVEGQLPDRLKRALLAWSEWEELRGDARRAAKLAREASGLT